MWFNITRFILRLILLVAVIVAGGYFFTFIYGFHTLSVEQLYDTLAILSNKPLLTIGVGIGVLLFMLSLLGLVMLIPYQIWRYPLSIFVGYLVGVVIYYQFHLLQPFQENVLQLNNDIWYYPLLMSTLLLLRAILGFKLPKRKSAKKSAV